MRGKKDLLARCSAFTGATRLLEALPASPSLLILNYHRIGDARNTPYDSGTLSATTAEFDWQVRFLKQRFPIVDLPQALDFIHGRKELARPSILLTFDDGYRDNFDEAFPVLRKHQVSATFFLPTAFIGTGELPWWDKIAYMVKQAALNQSSSTRITLTYPEPATFDLAPSEQARSIAQVLKLFKRPATDPGRFLRELAPACGVPAPLNAPERCFLTWDEARTMQQAGMCFGSHTHTHPILGKLPYPLQLEELQTSRTILERELGRTIDTLAYPVGQRDSFSADTFAALRSAGYSTAFSFYSGVNLPGKITPYNVLRGAVDGEDRSIFRLRLALRALTRRELL